MDGGGNLNFHHPKISSELVKVFLIDSALDGRGTFEPASSPLERKFPLVQ
jgi:hypothetical protein